MTRILLFFGCTLLVLYTPWFVFLPLVFWYALRFDAYELIVLGVLVDGLFGGHETLPVVTLTMFCVVVLALTVRPRLLLYT